MLSRDLKNQRNVGYVCHFCRCLSYDWMRKRKPSKNFLAGDLLPVTHTPKFIIFFLFSLFLLLIFFTVSPGTEEFDSSSRAYFKTRRQRSDSVRVFPFTSLEKSGRRAQFTALYLGRKYGCYFFLFFYCHDFIRISCCLTMQSMYCGILSRFK